MIKMTFEVRSQIMAYFNDMPLLTTHKADYRAHLTRLTVILSGLGLAKIGYFITLMPRIHLCYEAIKIHEERMWLHF